MPWNERVEEIVWKIKTLDEDELAELKERLASEWGDGLLPSEPDELATREPVRMPPSVSDVRRSA